MLQAGDSGAGLIVAEAGRLAIGENTLLLSKTMLMSKLKDRYDDTALSAPWSVADYVRWQREQEEREEAERETVNARIIARYDPECEAAVRALEEGGWGRQDHLVRGR